MRALFEVRKLGRLSYQEALDVQLDCFETVSLGGPDVLLFVEHDPVLTLGANFHEKNLKLPREEYAARGIELVRTDRGGDVTYHGPGQLVIYPIFNLAHRGKDLHRWLRDLEELVIRAVSFFGIEGRRFPPHTGVWVEDKKLAAIGIKVKRWVSIHGIAMNVNNELAPFDLIIPCGIEGYGVTSLSQCVGREVSLDEVTEVVMKVCVGVF